MATNCNWFFDGSNINADKNAEDENMKMAIVLKNMYDTFLVVGFTKSEAMQLLIGMVQGAAGGNKK